MKLLLLGLLLLSLPLSAASDTDTQKQIQEIESTLSILQQEQQNLFQQFQMLQELRRQAFLEESDAILLQQNQPIMGGSGLNYDEVQKRKQERFARIKDYSARLDEIHARYQEIDQERQTLIGELTGLRRSKPSASN